MSETTTADQTKAPPSKIEIQIGDKTQPVFMSFALLNRLAPMVGGIERIADFDFNAEIRELAVVFCIAPRDPQTKKIPEDYSIPDELDVEQTELLLDWVKGHVFSFFLRRLMNNLKIFEDNADLLKRSALLIPPQTS